MPRINGWRERPGRSLEDAEDVAFERLPIPVAFHAGPQFLSHNDAEILERRERSMESLEGLVRGRVAEPADEQLRVERVLPRRPSHGSRSGDVMSTPSMAPVPSTSSR